MVDAAVQHVAEVVAGQWRAVLEVDEVDVADDFFMLGGDSMRALKLVTGVSDELGIQFPLEVLFVEGTYGAVVAACEEAVRS
jgi:acyl carrier protein